MADVTGILLDGWFLDIPELRETLPARVLEILNDWRDSDLDLYEWDFPDPLPEDLQEVYEKLYVDLQIEQWCCRTPLWLSLNTKKPPTRSLHIFPVGSLASRMAAIVLARRVRGTRNAKVHKRLWPNGVELNADALIQVCAIRTWEWLMEQTGVVAFNLTTCDPEVIRAYRWIAALASNLSKDVKLFIWDERERNTRPVDLPLMDNEIYRNPDFLRCYLHRESPNIEPARTTYTHYMAGLDEDLNESENDKLKLVLNTWLEWKDKEKERERKKGSSNISIRGTAFLRHAFVE